MEILDFAGVPAFVTRRFDRQELAGGGVRRIHQEDFCQALSVYPSLKYEEDGGPTMADMMRLVAETSAPSYRRDDLKAFADLFAFNLLVAGVDAHAKNHSMLHVGGTSRLAPAYDLISAHGIWSAERVKYNSSAAVRYGKERKYRQITGRNLARAADVLRTPREEFMRTLDELAASLPDAVEASVAELPSGLVTERVAQMPERIGTFARAIIDRARGEDQSYTAVPRFEGPVAIGRLDTARVWESGKWRRDEWVIGRYRTRAARLQWSASSRSCKVVTETRHSALGCAARRRTWSRPRAAHPGATARSRDGHEDRQAQHGSSLTDRGEMSPPNTPEVSPMS